MNKIKSKPINNEEKYEKFENRAWLLYDVEFNNKPKKERKSVSNNKENSLKFMQNIKKKNEFSSERNNNNKDKTSSLLGKIGNNIISQLGTKPTNQPNKLEKNNNNDVINKINKKNINILNFDKKTYDSTETNNKINYNILPVKKDLLSNNKNIFSSNKNTYLNDFDSNEDGMESPSNKITIIEDKEAVMIHLNFVEILLDLEIALENKTLIATMINRLYKDCESEFIQNSRPLELFSITNVNRIYIKSLKTSLILIVIIKYILLEFPNYDTTLKSQMKKIINNLVEVFSILFDNFLFDNLQIETSQKKSSLLEKMKKILKSLSIQSLKQSKTKNNHEILFQVSKHIDNLFNLFKNLINCYFNFGFYVSIYNSTIDLIKNSEKFSFQKLFEVIQETLLFYIMKKDDVIKKVVSSSDILSSNPLALLSASLPTPYLPPIDGTTYTYSLVLDLDETLVHFFYTPSGGIFLLRPGVTEFLKDLSSIYEIIIFTAAMKEYADNILDILDPFNKIIKYRLYRQHTTLTGAGIAKNLANLGRNLEKIIIIDNLPENFKLQPHNGIGIKTWIDDINDNQLYDLLKMLKGMYENEKDIVNLRVQDVRTVIKKINEDLENIKLKNPNNPFSEVNIHQLI